MTEYVHRDEEPQPRTPETVWDRLKKIPGGIGWLVILVVVAGYFATGIYTVGPSEVGLVTRFGRYVRTVDPGMHYRLPSPIEAMTTVNVLGVRKEEIGFRTISSPPNPLYQTIETEALMLTGDGNITHVEMVVQYRVADAALFAFNLIDSSAIVKQAAEAVLRVQVARRTLDETLTEERDVIGMDTMVSLQELLDLYGAGIIVGNIQLQDVKPPAEVVSAFDDVNSARQDQQTLINQAEEYALDILPRIRGQAQEIANQAAAYKQERIKRAEGEVARFLEILANYQLGQEVTRTRIYIETMEEILPGIDKIILSGDATESGLLNFLDVGAPLDSTTTGGEQE